MRKHKLLAIILAIALVFTMLPSMALAEGVTADYSWYNATDTEFTLMDAADLLGFANIVNGTAEGIARNAFKSTTVKLGKDIDLSGINWTPIGGLVSYPGITFAGTFDGDGKTISNLTATDNTPNHATAGLFGSITGTVKNVKLTNVNITSTHHAGGVVGYSSNNGSSKIENCHVDGGTITSTPELIGDSYDNGDKVGGIIGYCVSGDTVTGCSVKNVTITAYRDLGGIVGCTAGKIENCSVGENVKLCINVEHNYKNFTTVDQFNANSVVGRNASATVTKCTGEATVNLVNCEAAIGDTQYFTLAAAIAAAQTGDTVKLLKNVNLGTASLTINTGITLDGGEEKYSITSSIGNAVIVVSTSEQVTIQNLKIFATASGKTGRGIAINDNAAKLDVKNVEIEATQRGITVNTNANDSIVLNVKNSKISLVESGHTAAEYDYDKVVFSTNDYNNSRGISLWEMKNSTVALENTTIQGFFYNINSAGSNPSTGMKVSATGCTFKGRAAVNQHAAGTEYTLTNCDITGINNFGGGSEGFGCIVVYQGATGNSITVNGGSIACVSFNEIGAANPNANEYLIDDRAGNNTFTLNNMTYTCPREYGDSKGGIVKAIRPGSVITVNGGTYTMPELVDASYSDNGEVGQMNILGGNFTYNVVSVNVSDPDVENALNITGGTFSSDPTTYVADSYIAKRVGSAEPYTYTVLARANLTDGVYMSSTEGATAPYYYSSNNGDGTWTVYYVPPYVPPTNTNTETTTNPDGSTTTTTTDKTTGTVTETTTSTTTDAAAGTTTETKVETVTDAAGAVTSTETVKTTDSTGTTGTTTTTTNSAGQTTVTAEATVTTAAVAEATRNEAPVTLPVEVAATGSTATAPVVEIQVPATATEVKVEVPVENLTAGTVAVLVKPDGTEEIIKNTTMGENGVVVSLDGSATVKIVDNSKEFEDVHDADHWSESAVDFVSSREIFNGTSDTTFDPEVDMTRGMMATVLARYDGADTTGGENWYDKGVEWAKENEISDGTNPAGKLTREEMAVMLYRYVGSPDADGELDFPDAGDVSDYAAAAMRWAVENGLINGMDGKLNPKGFATRAQLAAILMRFCQNVAN